VTSTVAIDNFKHKASQLRGVQYFLRIAFLKHKASLTQSVPPGALKMNIRFGFVRPLGTQRTSVTGCVTSFL